MKRVCHSILHIILVSFIMNIQAHPSIRQFLDIEADVVEDIEEEEEEEQDIDGDF